MSNDVAEKKCLITSKTFEVSKVFSTEGLVSAKVNITSDCLIISIDSVVPDNRLLSNSKL